ncbi:MAG: ABC transporter substrate-binding protein [Halodesulfurarchaeum sp.]
MDADDDRKRISADVQSSDESNGVATSRRSFLLGSSAAIVGTALAGCAGGGDGGGETGNGEPEKPDSITVRAWGGVWQESLASAIGDPFTEETGIDVTYDNTDIQVTANKIRSAVEQEREPPVNVNWSIVAFVHREYRQDLAAPLDPEIITHADELLPMARPDVDGDLPYIGLYPYTYALTYNEETLEEVQGSSEPVSSWEELWDEQFEDWIGIYNDPPGDGLYPVLAELAGVELGPAEEMEPMWDLVRDLEPNIGFLGSDSSIPQNLQEGEIAYAAGYLPNNLLGPIDEGAPLGWTIPEEGAAVRMDCMYTPKNQPSEEEYWSQQFVDFALREENQRNWMEGLQVPMFNENVEPLEWMEGDPAFPTTEAEIDALLQTDLDVYTEYSPEWFERFSQIVS